jgi:hypothetical protein
MPSIRWGVTAKTVSSSPSSGAETRQLAPALGSSRAMAPLDVGRGADGPAIEVQEIEDDQRALDRSDQGGPKGP